VPAGEIERLVVEQLQIVGLDPALVAQVREEVVGTAPVEEAELVHSLGQFKPVWEALTPAEQARVVQLLVDQILYDGGTGKIAVTFRPTMIRALGAGAGA
jgi:site-specific DNA recombinase